MKTLTFDNDKAFSKYESIGRALIAKTISNDLINPRILEVVKTE